MKRLLALGAFFSIFAFGLTAHAATWYVDASNSGPQDGLATTTAFTTIQSAITAAASGDTINVAAGTYTENLDITEPLTILGPNANVDPTGARNPEAVIAGGTGFTIQPEATNVTINGFTITADATGEAIYNVGADAADISGLNISYNIVTGGVRAISVESDATGAVSITNNSLTGQTHDITFGDNSVATVRINNNTLNLPTDGSYAVQMGPSGTGVITSFEFKNNHDYSDNNIGSNISNGDISGNVFDESNSAGPELQIALHNPSTVSGNQFNGHSAASCLQLFGSQYGLVPSDHVTVSGNTFTNCGAAANAPYAYAIQLSQDVTNITINGNNVITGAYDGINTRPVSAPDSSWDLSSSNIHINDNSITGSTHMGINNVAGGSLDAALNYWGVDDPSTIMGGTVAFSPWYTNAGMTSLSNNTTIPDADGNVTVTETTPAVVITSTSTPVTVTTGSVAAPTLDLSALTTAGVASIPQITVSSNVAAVVIPTTTITSSDPSWNGVINLPKVVTTTVAPVVSSDKVANVTQSIEIGAGDTPLTLNDAAKLVFAGRAGQSVGWSQAGSFHEITATCDSQTNPTLAAGTDCKIDIGSDLVVYTKHFTTFTTYTESNAPVASTGGGSSVGGHRQDISDLTSTGAQGQVLGAFTTADNQAQIAVIKKQLAVLISQLIKLLQAQLAADIAAGQH